MTRVKLNSNEKLARVNSGLDGNAKHFSMDSEEKIVKTIDLEQTAKYEQAANDYGQKFDDYAAELAGSADDLSKHPNLQIFPLYDNVLVKPFETNPFQKIRKTAGGIIFDMGGAISTIHKDQDTGEFVEEKQYIFQGTVVSVGPDCKYLKEGDIVMWAQPCELPIPFYKLGFKRVNERNVLCVINDDLEERFGNGR